MKLSDFKNRLKTVQDIQFVLPNGDAVPAHFHVTEVGQIEKHFIDCGGTVRHEKVVSFQLWEANDFDHRLSPTKLNSIIDLSEKVLGVEDQEIEVEYQADTIGKYALAFSEGRFHLNSKQTDCLAPDRCGIPQEKLKLQLSDLQNNKTSCKPGSGCC